MTKEVRVLFLTALTLSVYAVSIYLNQGALIFPFPLNELILLVVAIQFAFWHHNKRIPTLYILGFGVYSLLAQKNLMARFCSILFIVMYISSVTYLPSDFSFYGLIIMTVGLFIQSVHRPFHLFWMLLLLLESAKYLTVLLNN